MGGALRRHATTILVALVTAAVTAGGPALAHGVEHALFAHHADRVDGKHAVAAAASVSDRAGKLVATNASGRLPNNIISKAPDANKLDGIDSKGFLRKDAKAANADKLDNLNSTDFSRSVLPSGEVLTGEYAVRGKGEVLDVFVNFRIPLSAGVPFTFIPGGGPFTTECPGIGQAAPGRLCVYESISLNRTFGNVYNHRSGNSQNGASQDGFGMFFTPVNSADLLYSFGAWAVGAP